MADTFQLEIATPERRIVNEPVREAELPGESGYFGVLPDHAALLSVLAPGVVTYQDAAGTHVLAIYGGFVEVLENHVRVLATNAVPGESIQADSARHEVEEASRAVRHAQEQPESDHAMEAYKKAVARLDAAERATGAGRA
jgi:F-type H+-transporting ATPase subunit epsilon